MSYRLGIDVGSSSIAAAICRDEPGQLVRLELVPLGTWSAVVRSVVYLAQDGEVIVGEAAERRAAADPERMVGELTRGIGGAAPIEIGGVRYAVADLLAQVIRWVVDRVAQREGSPAHGVTVAHPAGWDPSKIQALADALGEARLPDLRFCTGPQAAAASYSTRERIEDGATLAVYDLGGGSFETAVLRKTAGGTFAILGDPERTEGVGGAVFDNAVFAHVRAAIPALSELEPEAGATGRVQRSLALCRRECTAAKEALSVETEVTIPVLLPQLQSQVLLTRTELEQLIRPDLEQTVEALHRTLRSAALGPAELDAVLLVGGSSRVPLVARLLCAELGCPVVLGDDPQAAIALGAALCGLPACVAFPVGVDTEVPAPARAGTSDTPDPIDPELPPWLATAAADADPPDDQDQPASSPRLSRYAVAGLLGLVIAGGAVSVPFILSSHDGPTPAPAAGIPAPAIPPRTTPPAESPALETPALETPTPQSPSPAPVPPEAGVPAPDSGADPDPLAGAAPPAPITTPGGTARSRAGAPHANPSRAKPAPAPEPPPPPQHVPDWVNSARG